MGFYTGQGDYYTGMGDPGIFSSIAKVVGGVARAAVGTVVGASPVGTVVRAATGILSGGSKSAPSIPSMPTIRYAAAPTNGRTAAVVPGMTADTRGFRKRRRMNVGNAKALRRAIRREEGFVKLARRALKGTGYAVTRRGSRARPRTVNIRETGPGSVSARF